ncbi:hypothetical protein C7293_22645 [filamentous cyanobacterium CCT1]|nr:hypothetical protein C7293_22645 [filamentous cyanobacterium CCT1]PSN77052.1 hypothetical protein C8B47_24120 [filamentous cyanobacterium CCP4]
MQPAQTPFDQRTPFNAEANAKDLIVISSELEGYRFLAEVTPQTAVLLLNQRWDGVTAIAQYLATLASVRRLHLVTPSVEGGLQLGRVTLRFDNLPHYARSLSVWRSHLAPQAEILIYNGEVASTEAGQLLIDVLHHLTGAAIAARTTLPNALVPNGTWELDCATQALETRAVLSPALATPISPVKLSRATDPTVIHR